MGENRERCEVEIYREGTGGRSRPKGKRGRRPEC